MCNKIKGGYILQPRCIDDSEVMDMAPATREIWFYILRKVNHKTHKGVERGSGHINSQQIIEDLSWYVGFRKMSYTKNQVMKSLRRLREASMIDTTKTTRGMLVKVLKYSHYQDPSSYEGHNEETMKDSRRTQGASTINKNDKNVINIKEKIQKKKVGEALAIVQYEISNLEEYRMSLLRSDERATHKQEICSLVSSVAELKELEGSLKAEALKESQADEAKLQSKPPEPKEEKPKKMGKNQHGFPKLTKGQIDKAKDLPIEHKCKDIFDFIWKNWGRRDDKAAARWAWYKVCLASTPEEIAELGKKLLRVVNYYRSTPNERHFCKKLGNFLNQGNHEELDAKYLEFTSSRLLPEIPKEGEKKEKDRPKKVILVPTANRDQEDFERLQETVRKIEEREERDANNQ